jgi:O-antigen/teichoic acid export membrane protein
MHDKKKDLIKNTFIIALGSLSVQLISFLLLPLYTTFLPTRDFGVVDLITTYTNLVAPLVILQLNMAAFRFLIDARNDKDEKTRIISNAMQLALLLTAVFVLLFNVTTRFVHISYASLFLLMVVSTVPPSMFFQFARGFGQNKTYAIASIVSGSTAVMLNVLLIPFLHMGASGMLISMIAANVVCSIYLFVALRLHEYIRPLRSVVGLQRSLITYAWPLVPNTVSWWVITASDRTIISIFLGLSANGIYAVAYKFPTAFSILFSVFSLSWTESASVHIDSADRDSYFSEIANASVRFFGSLAALMVAYLALLFPLLVGQHYNQAYSYIPILIAGAFFSSLVGVYSAIYVAKKLTKQIANTSIFAAIINISISLALVKFIGMYATALALVVGYMVMAVYRHYDTKKYIRLTYEKNVLLKVVILFALASGLYYYNNPLVNIYSAAMVTILAFLLNIQFVTAARNRLLGRLKKSHSQLMA